MLKWKNSDHTETGLWVPVVLPKTCGFAVQVQVKHPWVRFCGYGVQVGLR